MGKKSAKRKSESNGANLGFEAKLWLTADKLRKNTDTAEYKHVVLGLIFLHDILRRAYEYFRTQFTSAVGRNGGPFYTPRCIVRVLVKMLAPYKWRDPETVTQVARPNRYGPWGEKGAEQNPKR